MKNKNLLTKVIMSITALSITMAAVFTPDNNIDKVDLIRSQTPHAVVVEQLPESESNGEEEEEDKKQNVTRNARQLILDILKIIASVILAIVIKSLSLAFALFTKVFKGPLLNTVVDFLLIFGLTLFLAAMVFKILFPSRSLKELFTRKNLILIALFSFFIAFSGNFADCFKEYKTLLVTISITTQLLLYFFVYLRILKLSNTLIAKKKISYSLIMMIITMILKTILLNITVIRHYLNLVVFIIFALFVVAVILKFQHIYQKRQ